MRGSLHDFPFAHDQQVLAFDLDLGASVLRVEDEVTDLDIQGDSIPILIFTRSNGEHLAELRLFLGRIRDDEATRCGGLVLILGLHDNAVAQGL